MVAYYLPTDSQTITALQQGEAELEEEIRRLMELDELCFDIDKAWAGIHFLLCGSLDQGEGPLHDAILGGHDLGEEDFGYGPARYLEPGEVKACASALAAFDFGKEKEAFLAKVLGNPEIYPGYEDEESFNYLEYNFEALRAFFKEAAEEGKPLIICIS